MMLDRGYGLMAPAIAIAASLRLNANRGFNPQRFLVSLVESLEANVLAMPSHGKIASEAPIALAA
jgi:hypothetical protein